MAFLSVEMYSESLGKQMPLKIIMPQMPKGAPKCKCIYLLHGYSDDCSTWIRRTSVERYAEKYNLAVVMPDGAKSFYTNTASGDNYYDYVAKELPAQIEAMFNISDKTCDRYVGGISMGGYGALKVALREDGKYAGAISLSPVSDLKTFAENNDWVRFDSLFESGKNVPDSDNVLYLAEKCKMRPKIYLAIGLEDFLYENNRKTRSLLENLGYDFLYTEEHGDHTWDFWDRHIEKGLDWLFSDRKEHE